VKNCGITESLQYKVASLRLTHLAKKNIGEFPTTFLFFYFWQSNGKVDDKTRLLALSRICNWLDLKK
jgi:hypothetical protein